MFKNIFERTFSRSKSGFNGPIDVNYEQIPIYPEVQNIKCINKIIGKSIDSENSKYKILCWIFKNLFSSPRFFIYYFSIFIQKTYPKHWFLSIINLLQYIFIFAVLWFTYLQLRHKLLS